eukprot:TRINITY_DN8810_c0_g1_i4.p1 TRINITY_DN8810_c0_g1~~TRINITY_DN8810_c0_g1_i4.p1  ORF type:complete len:298 (-),score=46.04 TRINITY_DN8810_c0_g1_i4:212-1105(-)
MNAPRIFLASTPFLLLLIISSVISPSLQTGGISVFPHAECTWKAPTGQLYNYTSLAQRGIWRVEQVSNDSESAEYFAMQYSFNLCGNFSRVICDSQNVVAYQQVAILGVLSNPCTALGRANDSITEYIDDSQPEKGIRVTYASGDECLKGLLTESPEETRERLQNPRYYSVSYDLVCASLKESEDHFTPVQDLMGDSCNVRFMMKSNLGCKRLEKSPMSRFVLWGLGILIFAYLLVMFTVVMYGGKLAKNIANRKGCAKSWMQMFVRGYRGSIYISKRMWYMTSRPISSRRAGYGDI